MRNNFLKLSGFLIIWLACLDVSAQVRTITGTVKDAKGEVLVGVTVLAKGTVTGAYTDEEGQYALALPQNAAMIEFKYLGYKTMDVPVSSSNVVNITLEEDVLGLNEVVVTALGIPKEKKALGYSTQAVSGDDLNKSGSGNTLSELNGKVAGLTVINSSGTPGGGTYLRLRGVTSLTGNNQPLLIVDGIPVDNSINVYDPTNAGFQAAAANGNNTGGVNIDNRGVDINPNDIASITVLKGPAATALYGIEAASGAILITTKKGGGVKKGTNVSFNTSYSIDKVNKLPEMQSTYAQGSNGLYLSPESASGDKRFSWGPAIDTLYWDALPNLYDMHGNIVGQSDPSAVTKVTPYDPLDFFVTGRTMNNNLALSGGNEVSGYRLSVGNVSQAGIIPLTDLSKTTISLSGQATLLPKVKTSAGITYVSSNSEKVQNGSNISGVMLGMLRTPATFDNGNGSLDPANDPSSYVFPDGTQRNYRGGPGYDNPYWTVNRNPFHEDLDRTFGFFQVDYAPYDFMSITYRVGGDIYQQSHKNGFDIGSNQFSNGLLIVDNYHNQQINSDLILNFQKSFSKDWNGSLMLGHNYFTTSSRQQFTQGTGFSLPTFFDMSNATSYFSAEVTAKKRTMALYGQAQVDFKSMVYLTLTGRNETSSTLPEENNTFFYPSASLGFVFTEALGLSSSNVLPYGKIRLSWAQVGKDAPVQALNTYYVSTTVLDGFTTGVIYPVNGVSGYSLGSVISVIGNPNLKPEKTNSTEVGLDLGFLKNRLAVSATYYQGKTTDQIFTVAIPYTTGFSAAILNAGEISNKGLELTLNVSPIKSVNGFNWDFSINWNRNVNKVVALAPGIDNLFIAGFQGGAIYAVAGEPYGIIYGSRYERSEDGQLIINDDPNDPGYGMPIPGTVNGPIGDVNPDWTGSLINTFSYRGVSLGVQLDVRQGGDIWNGTKGAITYFGTSKESEDRGTTETFEGVTGHIDAEGNIVHYGPDGTSEEAGPGGANTTVATLDQYYYQFIGSSFIGPTEPDVEDGSFVRIRELSLSYDFPQSMLSSVHLTQFTLTLFANNPFLWTKYTGVDPETSLIGPANGQGLDYFNNPGIKSVGVRLNLGF